MVYKSWLEALNLNDENELLNLIEKIYHKLEAKSNQISPKYNDLIKLMKIFDLNKTKVIILGQDPYPTINQADGIAFSSSNGKLPKSLKNIFVELKKGLPISANRNLQFNKLTSSRNIIIKYYLNCWYK
ncbi:hypothetical protein ACUZ9N_00720 [Mycoplasmopsis gallinarum]